MKFKALSEKHSAHHHPLAKSKGLVIAYQAGSAEATANSWPAIDRLSEKFPEVVIWIDIHQSKDDVFVLHDSDYLGGKAANETKVGDHIWLKTFEELSALGLKGLSQTLDRYPNTHFALNVLSNKEKVDEKLSLLLKEKNAENRVILVSPFDIILKSTRTQSPLLMFGSGPAEQTILLMLSTLGLEALAPMKGDLFISTDPRVTKHISQDLIKEIHRRKKLAISGMVHTPQQREEMKQLGFDGVLTDAPFQLLDSAKNSY